MNIKNLAITIMMTSLAAFVLAQPPMHPRLGGGDPLYESLSTDFDRNADGEITLDEFGGAKSTFEHLDRNHDGILSSDDFEVRSRLSRSGRRGMSGRAPVGGLVFRLADSDADATVSSEEVGSFLTAIDGNGDGVIEREEFSAILPERPHASGGRSASFGRPFDHDGDGVFETSDLEAILSELDRNGDGEISGEEVPRFRSRRSERGPRAGRGGAGGFLFLRLADMDENREVTSGEWQSAVTAIDADGDGVISAEEIQAAAPGGAAHPPSPEFFDMLTARLDRDGDGLVETGDLDTIFAELDRDGDGVIAEDERPHHRSRSRQSRFG